MNGKRTIVILAAIILLSGVIFRFLPPSSATTHEIIAQADYSILPDDQASARRTVAHSFIASPFVVRGTVVKDYTGVENASDPGEGWMLSSVKPIDVLKGLCISRPLLISSLGNQKKTWSDLSMFSMNRRVRSGDSCIAFLGINWFLTRKCRRMVYRCKKVIVLKNTENTTNAYPVTRAFHARLPEMLNVDVVPGRSDLLVYPIRGTLVQTMEVIS